MSSTYAAGPFVLRELTVEDWPIERDLSRQPDVVRWTYYPPDLEEEQSRARILAYLERAAQGVVRRFVILDGTTPLGTCGIGRLTDPVPDVFYALLPTARGRGAATSAVQALCSLLAEQGRTEVALETIEGNATSERVAERAGFVRAAQHPGEVRGRPVVLNRWVRR